MSAALAMAVSPMLLFSAPTDDAQAAEQVRKQIVKTPFYSIFDNVQFTLNDGELILTGEVSRPVVRTTIGKATARVAGVDRVINSIEVQPVSFYDNRIRRAMVHQIYGNPTLARLTAQRIPPIHIIVNNGHVTLEGIVLNEGLKRLAFLKASGVNGVFSVTNNLRTEI